MDAIDILGGLFGRKRGGSGGAPDLSEIFGRKPQAPANQRGSSTDPRDIDAQAKELEDILNVGRKREEQRHSNPAPPASAPSGGIAVDSPFSDKSRGQSPQNDQALVLVRAMVNAAKADGQISSDEQQAILQHFEGASNDALQFLRKELSQPLDVREFAWSVPIGLEQQVYAMSLIAIAVDTKAEQAYLGELAHALRLQPEVQEQLHQRFARK